MIDAIQNPAPQQGIVEGASDSGKQSASSGLSFTDALTAAVSGEQAKPGQANAKQGQVGPVEVKPAEAKPESDAAKVSEMAGAVQVAVAVPVQSNATFTVADVPAATAKTADAPAETDVVQQIQPRVVANAQAQASLMEPTMQQVPAATEQPKEATSNASDAKPGAGAAAVQNQTTQTVPHADASSVTEAPSSTPSTDQSTAATEKPVPSQVVSQAPNASPASSTDRAADANAQASVPTAEPAAAPMEVAEAGVQANVATNVQVQAEQPMVKAEQVKASDSQDSKTEKKPESAKQGNGAAGPAQAQKVPVETVPVQWRFDGQSQVATTVTGSNTAQVVGSLADSTTKAASTDTATAKGQAASDAQVGVPAGVQFGAQLNQAAQKTASQTSDSDVHVRVIDQVVRQVSLSRIDGHSNLVVKLNPPDLGSLRLQITQDATGMSTHIQASSSQVRGLLEAHMTTLMDSLAKAGLRMDNVSVSVDTSTANAFAGSAHQGDAHPNSNQARQQYAQSRGMGGVGTIADASFPTWGKSAQAGYSWLA